MTALEETAVRDYLKSMIDEVPARELDTVKTFLQYVVDMQDPFLRALADAAWDGEPLTEEDRIAIAESKADIAAGRTISSDQLKKELGI